MEFTSYYLPTRKDCLEITKNNEAFYVSKKNIDGYEIEMYDYRLASYMDFFPSNFSYKEKNYTELRGLTFIFNPDTKKWERNIAMQKFFNVNQTKNWLEKDFKEKNLEIVSFSNKLDGSLILPIKMPNGDIKLKTKMSFVSEQAIAAQKIYDENKLGDYQGLIKYCFDVLGVQLMFEYTSFNNQIVISYNEEKLTILQARYIHNGKYLTPKELIILSSNFNVPLTKQYKLDDSIYDFLLKYDLDTLKELLYDKDNNDIYKFDTLDDMIKFIGDKTYLTNDVSKKITMLDFLLLSRNYIQKEEGEVIIFNNGQMAKIKNEKYFQLHGLVSEGTRENFLIKTILDDNIDDVLSQVPEGDKRIFIENITNKVTKHFNHYVSLIKKIANTYSSFNDRKEFAKQHKDFIYFGILMKSISLVSNIDELEAEKAIENMLKTLILKKTYHLEEAKKWLNTI